MDKFERIRNLLLLLASNLMLVVDTLEYLKLVWVDTLFSVINALTSYKNFSLEQESNKSSASKIKRIPVLTLSINP